jgi:hypothetical protein
MLIVALPTFQRISPAKAPTATFFKENPAKAAAVPGTEDTAQTFIPAAPAFLPPAAPPTTILLGCLLISPALWSSAGLPAGVIRNLALTESFREDPSSTWRLETIPSCSMLLWARMGEIAKSKQKSDKIRFDINSTWYNMKMTILRKILFKFWYGDYKKICFANVIILDIILWLFYMQNINFILFFSQNLDLHNVISILHQFD